MSEDHKVNKIVGNMYGIPMFHNTLKQYMVRWMLLGLYEVDEASDDHHVYFNYALEKHLVNLLDGGGTEYKVSLSKKGMRFINGHK
jgi:hypothetical protein